MSNDLLVLLEQARDGDRVAAGRLLENYSAYLTLLARVQIGRRLQGKADLMAYVGCIAGAIAIDDYRQDLAAAGFNAVHVADTGADLNAYAKVEGQGGCCSPGMAASAERGSGTRIGSTPAAAGAPSSLSIVSQGCCDPAVQPPQGESLHARLAELLERYDVNEYAASVRVYAVKPAQP